VRDVLNAVRERAGAERLPPAPLVAVNETYAGLDDPVAARDEVAIIPPVAGG
jgi:sulfur-carrier protein